MQVLAAQTRLAQSMKLKPSFYEVYLMEILSLFADKGVAIQTAATTHNNAAEVTSFYYLSSLSELTNDSSQISHRSCVHSYYLWTLYCRMKTFSRT
jgi:hypothetical protein